MSAARPSRRLSLRGFRLAVVALLLALTAGCGTGGDDAGDAAASPASTESPAATDSEDAAEQVVVTIDGFSFATPAEVPAGAEVTVVNEDGAFHTLTADDGAFDVDVPGRETVSFMAPEEPGEYPFHCMPHPFMTATLVVT